MPLFRWRFGARNAETSAGGITAQDNANDNNPPPPSYEDSQRASLQAVLEGACVVAPLLWPSACSASTASPSSSQPAHTDDSKGSISEKRSETREEKQTAQSRGPALSTDEIAMLANLALAPCGGRPFLERIREFSDFYFTPYVESAGAGALQPPEKASGCSSSRKTARPQEQQQRVLQSLGAPRESAALVLCARVLQDYYRGLGNVDSAAEDAAPSHGAGEKQASEPAGTAPLAKPRRKTRLTQVAGCLEASCNCSDYDDAAGLTAPPPLPPSTNADSSTSPATAQRCVCGHARSMHSSASSTGLARVLRRYTNWHNDWRNGAYGAYMALGHRGPEGQMKRDIKAIRVCGAVDGGGRACPCRDYDYGEPAGLCACCGHDDAKHVDIASVKKPSEPERRRGRMKKEKGTSSVARAGQGTNDGEWELSWILIETGYLLLQQIMSDLKNGNS